jgi:hypothetical protein
VGLWLFDLDQPLCCDLAVDTLPSLCGAAPAGCAAEAGSIRLGTVGRFVKNTSDRLVAIVNSADSPSESVAGCRRFVDGIARFCLGCFWRIAHSCDFTAYLARHQYNIHVLVD